MYWWHPGTFTFFCSLLRFQSWPTRKAKGAELKSRHKPNSSNLNLLKLNSLLWKPSDYVPELCHSLLQNALKLCRPCLKPLILACVHILPRNTEIQISSPPFCFHVIFYTFLLASSPTKVHRTWKLTWTRKRVSIAQGLNNRTQNYVYLPLLLLYCRI
jgi:hypothetical protein